MLLFERPFSYVEAAMRANTQYQILIGWQVNVTIELEGERGATVPYCSDL
jgi:hypothetical protein